MWCLLAPRARFRLRFRIWFWFWLWFLFCFGFRFHETRVQDSGFRSWVVAIIKIDTKAGCFSRAPTCWQWKMRPRPSSVWWGIPRRLACLLGGTNWYARQVNNVNNCKRKKLRNSSRQALYEFQIISLSEVAEYFSGHPTFFFRSLVREPTNNLNLNILIFMEMAGIFGGSKSFF